MTAAIRQSLTGLEQALEGLDLALAARRKKTDKGQQDLFGMFSGGRKGRVKTPPITSEAEEDGAANTNETAVLAARLDMAIAKVEEILKEA